MPGFVFLISNGLRFKLGPGGYIFGSGCGALGIILPFACRGGKGVDKGWKPPSYPGEQVYCR